MPIELELAPCGVGTFRDEHGYCMPCALGRFQDREQHLQPICKGCAVGSATKLQGAKACEVCQKGRYQKMQAQARCYACVPGRFSPDDGAVVCTSCPRGRKATYKGRSVCAACATGEYQDLEGQTACKLCPAGTEDGGADKTKCAECVGGTFKPNVGLGKCAKCEPDKVSNRQRTGCTCKAGYFVVNHTSTLIQTCVKCDIGMKCEDPGLNFAQVETKPGYWQVKEWYETPAQQERFAMLQCPILAENICLGGSDALDASNVNTTTCREGHTGPLCTLCLPKYAKMSTGLCTLCGEPTSLSDRMVNLAICACVFVACLLAWVYTHRKQLAKKLSANEDKAKKCLHIQSIDRRGAALKIKIILGLFQVSSALVASFDIAWPKKYTDFVDSFDWVNLEIPGTGCMVETNFVDQWLSAVLTPLAIGAPLIAAFFTFQLVFTLSRQKGHDKQGRQNRMLHSSELCLKWVIYMLFLIYPSTSSIILRMFDCTTLENGDAYLKADFSIQCGAATVDTKAFGTTFDFNHYQRWAAFTIVLYPIGVPVFFFLVLWLCRSELYIEGTDTPNPEKAAELGFLYAGYTKKYWWWEFVELFRKLMLTGIIAFYKPGSPQQLFLAVLLALTFIVGYAREKPYKNPSASDLQLVCQLQIFFTSFAGFAVKMNSLLTAATDGKTENPFSSPGFSSLLLAVGIAPLVLLFVQVVLSMVAQAKDAKKEGGKSNGASSELVAAGGEGEGAAFFASGSAKKKNPLGVGEETKTNQIVSTGKKSKKTKKVLI